MRDSREIKALEAEIALNKQKFSEVERLEAEAVDSATPQGFKTASIIGKYRVEKEALAKAIRVNEEMLAGAKSQPEWPHE